jgi:hypothetical protein
MSSLAFACVANITGLAVCILFGTFTLYVHNNLLPLIYLAYSICVIIAHTYLYCTRCVYYGKDCYIFGGRISKKYFKARHNGPMDPDDAITASLWMMVALFPLPFLLYYQDIILASIYLIFFWGWFYIHKSTACTICDNKWCGLNQKHKK